MFRTFPIAAAVIAAAIATPALAADPRVNIINESGETIARVEMSGVYAESWGRDLLGQYVLRTGYHLDLVEPSYSSGNCRYDLRVTFNSGRRMVIRNFNACATTDVTIYNQNIYLA